MQGIYFFRVEYLLLGNYLGEVQLAIAPVDIAGCWTKTKDYQMRILGTVKYLDEEFFAKIVNSFMTEVLIIYLLIKSMDWFLYDRDLCHERVNS